MLDISLRTAKLGPSINSRTQKHGKNDVPAGDVTVDSMYLTDDELNSITGIKDAYDRLFARASVGGLAEPVFGALAPPMVLPEKFEKATVVIEYGLKPHTIELDDVSIAKVTLEPQSGGMTRLSLQLQVVEGWEGRAQKLIGLQNHEVKISIADAEVAKKQAKDKNQEQLPLSGGGDTGNKPEKLTHPEQLFEKPSGKTRRTPKPKLDA